MSHAAVVILIAIIGWVSDLTAATAGTFTATGLPRHRSPNCMAWLPLFD
jgi:hypothetical protein